MTAPALVIATGNTHKIEEMKALLSGFIPGLDQGSVATLADFSADSPVEDGLTFSENALIKARSLAQATERAVAAVMVAGPAPTARTDT